MSRPFFSIDKFSIHHKTKLIAEASELGLKKIPAFIEVEGKEQIRLFGPCRPRIANGEVIGWVYPQNNGTTPVCSVEVIND